MTKKRNETSELIPLDVEEMVQGLIEAKAGKKGLDRKTKFYLYMLFGVKPPVAAQLCGYSRHTGYNMTKEFKKSPKTRATLERFIGGMPEAYRNLCKVRLPMIAEIETQSLLEYQKDPKLAIDKPQLLKHLKQSSGVLDSDTPPSPPFIDIGRVQNLMLNIHVKDGAVKVLPDPDGEDGIS